MLTEEGPITAASPSLTAMMAMKATGTLHKRATSLKLYRAWYLTTSHPPEDFIAEHTVYSYASFLYAEGAPATRASALREAISMVATAFGTDAAPIRNSSRIHGMCFTLLRNAEKSDSAARSQSRC